jgi:hypothetical protein
MSCGTVSGTGCLVLQPFATGGNQSYSDSWAVTGDQRYPGYKTLTLLLSSYILEAIMNNTSIVLHIHILFLSGQESECHF